jgi:hypothetical protein
LFILLFPVFGLAASAHARSRILFPFSPCTEKSTLPGCNTPNLSTALVPYTPKIYPDHGLDDQLTDQGKQARGFYITPMYLVALGPERTANAMKQGRYDTVVIDVKDDLGQILYPSKVPLAEKQLRVLIPDPKTMVQTFHENGIYVIARIVSFKDSRLPYVRPDLAMRSGNRAQRLYTSGENWLDQYSAEVQDYLVDLTREIENFGFDEVQFDYIRFPKGRATQFATWLHRTEDSPPRHEVIAKFLERVDRAVTIPISADVFGLTTFVDGDPRGLGQHIERMSSFIEAISPMMYANGMDTYFRDGNITSHVIELIQCGLQRARLKAKGIVLRPYLQAYSNGVEHLWGPQFVKDQIQAAFRAESDGFLLWNPTMKNGPAMAAHRDLVDRSEVNMTYSKRRWPEVITARWCPAKGALFDVASATSSEAKSSRAN